MVYNSIYFLSHEAFKIMNEAQLQKLINLSTQIFTKTFIFSLVNFATWPFNHVLYRTENVNK
jgi:hypothetical protein